MPTDPDHGAAAVAKDDLIGRLEGWADYEPAKMFGEEILNDVAEAATALATRDARIVELSEAVAAASFLIDKITYLEGREGLTDYQFAEQVIALAHSKRDEIRAALKPEAR